MNINQPHIDRLVQEAQKGNKKAFGEIYDIFFTHIHKYVYYKVSSDQVDDLVGTIFLKTWIKLKKYKKGVFPFSSWLFRIAHNAIIDHYRTHKEFYELEEKIIEDESLNPQTITSQLLNSERIHRALHYLGKPYQEVLVLKFMNNMSNREVADILQTSENNVRTLQFRALKKMKEIFEKQEALLKTPQQGEKTAKVGFFRKIFARSA